MKKGGENRKRVKGREKKRKERKKRKGREIEG